MKPRRLATLVLLAGGILGLAMYESRGPAGFATPADCVAAYGEASRAGDVARYLCCLGEPLRSETERRIRDANDLAEALRQDLKEVKSWVQELDPVIEGSRAHVEVDEVRVNGNRRIAFRLERGSRGWLIVGIDPPKSLPTIIPYGTHVSKVPEEARAQPEP